MKHVLLLLLVCSCFASLFWSLSDGGLGRGNDGYVHRGNVLESSRLLEHRLPPWDWLPDVAGGYGGPNFLYYGHLGFVFPAWLVNLGVHPVDAIRAWIVLAFILAGVGAFLWCRCFAEWRVAAAGALVYAWTPYVMTLAFSRCGYPELTAAALAPWAFWAFERRRLVLLAAFFGLTVAIHTLSLILLGSMLGLYAAVQGLLEHRWRPVGIAAAGMVLGSLLAAPYLAYPIFGRGLVYIAHQGPQFDNYANAGLPLACVLNKTSSGRFVLGYVYPGRVHLLLLAGVVAILSLGHRSRRAGVLLGLAAGTLVLSTSIGAHLTNWVPALNYLQFPFRYLTFFGLFTAGAFAAAAGASGYGRLCAWGAPALLVAFYGTISPDNSARPEVTIPRLRASKLTLDHENKYMPLGAHINEEREADLRLLLLEGPGTASRRTLGLNDYAFAVEVQDTTTAYFEQYWFPGWRCEIDGEAAPLTQGEVLGRCKLQVPPGRHEVHIWFGDTPLRAWAKWVALVTAIALAMAASLSLFLRRWGYIHPSSSMFESPQCAEKKEVVEFAHRLL